MYVRMVIGEANTDEQTQEVAVMMGRHIKESLRGSPGFKAANVIHEEDGRMVILMTTWETREDCIRYHCGRAYRQLVAAAQHLLVGEFVVKLFKESLPAVQKPKPHIVCIVDGGILDEVLSDQPVKVLKVDRDKDAQTTEIRRLMDADEQLDDVERFFAEPVTCDNCDDDQDGGARLAAVRWAVGVNEYNLCWECTQVGDMPLGKEVARS